MLTKIKIKMSNQTKSANPIVEAVAATIITSVGELSLEQILQKLVTKSKSKGKAGLKAGKAFASILKDYALETNTKIDDALAAAIEQACTNVAKANKIAI